MSSVLSAADLDRRRRIESALRGTVGEEALRSGSRGGVHGTAGTPEGFYSPGQGQPDTPMYRGQSQPLDAAVGHRGDPNGISSGSPSGTSLSLQPNGWQQERRPEAQGTQAALAASTSTGVDVQQLLQLLATQAEEQARLSTALAEQALAQRQLEEEVSRLKGAPAQGHDSTGSVATGSGYGSGSGADPAVGTVTPLAAPAADNPIYSGRLPTAHQSSEGKSAPGSGGSDAGHKPARRAAPVPAAVAAASRSAYLRMRAIQSNASKAKAGRETTGDRGAASPPTQS